LEADINLQKYTTVTLENVNTKRQLDVCDAVHCGYMIHPAAKGKKVKVKVLYSC